MGKLDQLYRPVGRHIDAAITHSMMVCRDIMRWFDHQCEPSLRPHLLEEKYRRLKLYSKTKVFDNNLDIHRVWELVIKSTYSETNSFIKLK